MTRFPLRICCLGVLLFSVAASAQPRPDFSGRWTSEPAGRGDMGSGWGTQIEITQDAARLAVEYAFFGRGDMQRPLRFEYALDGTESKNAVMMGRGVQSQTSTTKWDGQTLIITTRHDYTDPSTGKPATAEVTQALTLESAASLVVETTRAGVMGGPPTRTRTVYRKN
jgi:arylsulfatase